MKYSILHKFFIPALAVCISFSAHSQTAYTMHTIAAGETLSALAKSYHTTVGDIMRINAMHTDSKLKIGEKVKIPASTAAAATPAKAQTAPATVAAEKEAKTHVVKSGESLYHISETYKISLQKLMALNGITDANTIKAGQVLLVSSGTPPPAKTKVVAPMPAADTQQNNVQEQAIQEQLQTSVTTPDTTTVTAAPAPLQTPVAPVEKPLTNTVINTPSSAEQPVVANTSSATSFAPGEGFFTSQFRQNVEGRNEQTKTGVSMTFKSASGWADKKFYVLMNDAPPGSIVRLVNGNKTVYAKVLWNLGSQKENEGLDFRISTAAAAAFNITEEKFTVTVTYFQ